MNLSEYITSEFGIVPDEVQLEQIRKIIHNERIDNFKTKKSNVFHSFDRFGQCVTTVISGTDNSSPMNILGALPSTPNITASNSIIIGNKDTL